MSYKISPEVMEKSVDRYMKECFVSLVNKLQDCPSGSKYFFDTPVVVDGKWYRVSVQATLAPLEGDKND
jgi:hypothetical protein